MLTLTSNLLALMLWSVLWICLTVRIHQKEKLTLPFQIYYSPTLFQTMGLDHSMQLIMSGVLNITQLIGVSTSLFTMDRFGRRPLLLWGSLFMTISHLVIAVLVGRFSSNWPAHRVEGWVSIASGLFDEEMTDDTVSIGQRRFPSFSMRKVTGL